MTIGTCMKRTVYSISSNETVRQAAELFVERRIGLLPVVDDQGRPQGILRLEHCSQTPVALPHW